MARKKPIAFMSYVQFDDEHESGRLTEFRERLSAEVRMHTGEEFPIFQDRNAIKWGQHWKERIDESLDDVTFLIPIITPSFFKSPACRDEVERFLKREKELERNDLILPIYYVDAPLLNDRKKRAKDKLAESIAECQYADWRDLRFEPFTSLKVGKAMAALAVQMREALEQRVVPKKLKAKKPTTKKRKRKGAKTSEATAAIESVSAGETKKGPSAKTEPPTRIVDPMHRADYGTISEAIKAADPGDRIIVRPGFYQERLVIDKPLEIIGEGKLGEVVIQAKGGNCILFKTTMGRVANLTIQQMGGGDFFGVNISQGRLELEDCDITSHSFSCIAIRGGADPIVRQNIIHDSAQGGIFVFQGSQGTIENNTIFGNAYAGVEISEGGDPMLRQNRIHDGKVAGVYIHLNGKGTLEDNDIFGNAFTGVEIKEGGNPTLRRNRINKNGYTAIWIHDNGGGTFEDNDFRANPGGAWDIDKSSLPKVTRTNNLE